jgi:site-specific recombinase XerD
LTLLKTAKPEGTDVTLHTLRHTWASRMAESGTELRTLMDLGGWSDLSMVQRYTHPGQHRATVERLASWNAAQAADILIPDTIH